MGRTAGGAGRPVNSTPGRTVSRFVRSALAFTGITLALFLLLEGGTSVLLFVRTLQRLPDSRIAEASHATFDPELGWVNRPHVSIRDFYGPGKHITINSQGFRNDEDFDVKIPLGMRRVICSGDSFTLGYGVSNESTWCSLLSTLNPSLQAVNMGQGGYGIDQAYLWYVRDGLSLEHNVQILAFVSDDFRRMGTSRFLGYGKPSLTLEEGSLVLTPAKEYSAASRWLSKNGRIFLQLRSVEFLDRFGLASHNRSEWTGTLELAEAIFEELTRMHRDRGTALVLVYLPEHGSREPASAERRHRIAEFAQRWNVTFLDLLAEYQAFDLRTADALFNPGDGHLSELGNRWVAERLLEEIPELSRQ